MRYLNDPDGTRLPVKIDAATNGEFAPIPLEDVHRRARRLALESAADNARRLGMGRRPFLVSACGVATTLLGLNAAYAAVGRRGGFFELRPEAALDLHAARSAVDGGEFVFDVQGHFVNPTGAWLRHLPPGARPMQGFARDARCEPHRGPGELDYLRCVGPEQFVKDVFLDSDTDVMVLSFVPSTRRGEPLTIEEAEATARIVERLDGTHRLLIHGRVNPNQEGDLEGMDELASRHRIAAWKTYTQWGPPPEQRGFFLDDEVGERLIERARKLGVRNIAVHKGLAFGPKSYEHSTCVDVGRAAKRHPDINFLIYHSGYVAGQKEGPYDPAKTDGVDALVTSLAKAGVKPGSNVYAELGSTWRFWMRDPDNAAHGLGKLLRHCGEDNVLWGTDSIWYGSPQDQIQAFRAFQIAPELRERHGYPELTPALRAKILGLNALAVYDLPKEVVREHLRGDKVAMERGAYRAERHDPAFATYGPKTRREFLNLKAWGG